MDESRFELFVGLMGSAAKSIQRLKAVKMKKYRLSAAHTTCLCKLADAGSSGLTQGELVAREGMDRAQVSRVLSDLRSRGYVSPLEEGGHYKKRYVLTTSGQAAAADIQAIILDINRFVSEQIPPEDIHIFYRTLRTIAQNLDRAVDAYL